MAAKLNEIKQLKEKLQHYEQVEESERKLKIEKYTAMFLSSMLGRGGQAVERLPHAMAAACQLVDFLEDKLNEKNV